MSVAPSRMFSSAPDAVSHVIVSCFQASHEVRADVSALSVLRLSKFVFTDHRKDAPVIQSLSTVIVAIVLN